MKTSFIAIFIIFETFTGGFVWALEQGAKRSKPCEHVSDAVKMLDNQSEVRTRSRIA